MCWDASPEVKPGRFRFLGFRVHGLTAIGEDDP